MASKKLLTKIHFLSTVWFVLSVAYIMVLALRQAGFDWWLIFSLSGYSVIVIVFILSIYLFAVFRGASRAQEPAIEHPLTSTTAYMVLYSASPVLGGLAGLLGTIGVTTARQFGLGIAVGTLAVTFIVWIIVDPLAGVVEITLPQCRQHRRQRLAQAQQLREEQKRQRQQLLDELEAREITEQWHRQQLLAPDAQKLAQLVVAENNLATHTAELEAIEIGIKAWQKGGIGGMQQLHQMALEICRRNPGHADVVDFISIWWDGIGQWRSGSLAYKS